MIVNGYKTKDMLIGRARNSLFRRWFSAMYRLNDWPLSSITHPTTWSGIVMLTRSRPKVHPARISWSN